MRKKLFYLVAAVLSVGLMLFAACNSGGKDDKKPDDEPTLQLELDKTALTLDVLAREQLEATVKDSDGKLQQAAIEWSTSNAAVATVDNGLVSALSAGSAQITAKSGELSAVCAVTVEANGVRPQLQLNVATDVELVSGESTKIVPSVRFKSTTLKDSDYGITYSFTASDGGFVSVAADGTVSALKYGNATVTVKANYPAATTAGLDGSLTQVVNVKVVPNYTLMVDLDDGFDANIYMQEYAEDETVYHAYTQLKVAAAIYLGQTITTGIVYKTSDAEIATVDETGKVSVAPTAHEGDTVEAWIEYATPNEGIIASDRITLTVRKAVVEEALDREILVDVASGEAEIPVDEIFGETGKHVVSVYDSEDVVKTNLYNVADGTLNDITLVGERSWVIEGDTIAYKIDVTVATKVIKTGAELAELFNKNSAIKDAFPGYYVLGNNITMNGEWNASSTKGYNSADGQGLTGTFNGRGYSIDGLTLGGGGLFGLVSNGATVKNVAFTNLKMNAGSNGLALIFGWTFFGTLENAYFGITEWTTSGSSSSSSLALFGICDDATLLKNIVVVVNCTPDHKSLAAPFDQQYGVLEATSNKGAWENTYVVSPDMRLFGQNQNGTTEGDAGTKYCKSVYRFDSLSELLASEDYANGKNVFNESIWNRDVLTFVNSVDTYKAELNSLPEELEIAANSTVALTTNRLSYLITLNDAATEAGIVLENGYVTATKFVDSAGAKATLTFGSETNEISLKVLSSITVENYSYTYNLADGDDFRITGSFPAEGAATVKIKGTDGNDITLPATVSGNTLTVASTDFTGEYMPSGVVEMTATVGEGTVNIIGVKLVYAINTVAEFNTMKNHLTFVSNSYRGSLVIGDNLDFDGGSITERITDFAGELDGGNKVISNIVMQGTQNAVFNILRGTVKNLIIKNATLTNYGGVIAHDCFGTVENCYISGSILRESALSAQSDNFGTGLLVGKVRNGSHIRNCIAELIAKGDTLYVAAAFGKLGDGSARELNIFENCYAVAANGFTLMTYGANRALKNFDVDSDEIHNGNKNFDSIFDLYEDETAAALAASLGLIAPVPDRISLSETQVSLYVADSVTLKATVLTASGEVISVPVEWTTQDTEVIRLENGVVTALAVGSATVKVTYGGIEATCTVTVTVPQVSRVELSATELYLTVEGSRTLTAKAYLEDGSEVAAEFTWTSSADGIATVANGTVTGVGAGTATITVKTGEVTATCQVSVTDITYADYALTDFVYEYNTDKDFVIENFAVEDERFPASPDLITAEIKGLDGNLITLTGITLADGVLTIPAAQFKVAQMPTKEVEMTLYFNGAPMKVTGAYLVYTINTYEELADMTAHLTATFDGHLKLGADIDFTGHPMTTGWKMRSKNFIGIFDGGHHTVSNVVYDTKATAMGLLGNLKAPAVVKNLIMKNVEINTYSGGIAYLNQGGTIENCYVQGSINADGMALGSNKANFGCGLLVGRSYTATSAIKNCIVEVTSHGVVYDGVEVTDTAQAKLFGGAAFGMMGSGVAQGNFTGCVAINAENFTLYTGGAANAASTFYNFTGATNANFASVDELLASENETAKELAASFGIVAATPDTDPEPAPEQ